jgi:hypothetical protein
LLGPELLADTQPHPPQKFDQEPGGKLNHLMPAAQITATAFASSNPTNSYFIQKTRLANFASEVSSGDLQADSMVYWSDTWSQNNEPRYHGQSSTEILSCEAMLLRELFGASHTYSPTTFPMRCRPEFWRPTTAETRMLNNDAWKMDKSLALELPPKDLMPTLLDEYFKNINRFFPILHRPLFEKQLEEGLHMREPNFLRVVLLVCANGARWCDDPRALDDGCPVTLSAGYRWFRQVESWHKYLDFGTSLLDAQILLASAPWHMMSVKDLFMQNSSLQSFFITRLHIAGRGRLLELLSVRCKVLGLIAGS